MFLPAGSDEAMTLPSGLLEETVPRHTLSTGSSLASGGQFWPGSSNATSQSLLVWAAGSPKGNKTSNPKDQQGRTGSCFPSCFVIFPVKQIVAKCQENLTFSHEAIPELGQGILNFVMLASQEAP